MELCTPCGTIVSEEYIQFAARLILAGIIN